MTSMITTTTTCNAASSGAGAAECISTYAQSDVRASRTPRFDETPWQKNALIWAHWDNSPLKSANVRKSTNFVVGQNDIRVPDPQSVRMCGAMLYKMNVEPAWFEKYATNRPH